MSSSRCPEETHANALKYVKLSHLLTVAIPSLAVFLLTVMVSLYVSLKVSYNYNKCFIMQILFQAHCQGNIVHPVQNSNGQSSDNIRLRKNTSIIER